MRAKQGYDPVAGSRILAERFRERLAPAPHATVIYVFSSREQAQAEYDRVRRHLVTVGVGEGLLGYPCRKSA